MGQISDTELHSLVEQVVSRALGLPQPATPTLDSPAPQSSEVTSPSKKELSVAIGADHGGFDMKEALKKDLAEWGYEAIDVGTHSKEAVDYPDFAHQVAQLVTTGKAWRGVMIDGAGIGSCMVANKVPGVRAAMAYDISSATNSREHNNANLLTLGAGLIGLQLAKQILKTWLETDFGGGRHTKRVDKITEIEKKYLTK